MSSRPPWRGSSWPARSSTTRAGAQRDPERWQRASQLVTHGLLRDAGFTLPPDAEAWDGISVEQAYDRLPEPDPDDGDNNARSGGADADSAGTPPSPDSRGDDDSGGSDDAAGDGDPQDGDGQETGADAPPSCDPAGTGEVMDAPADGGQGGAAPSPADIAAEEQAWDEAMHQAASLAKAQGRMPGAVEETVRGAHASTVDWRTLLRRYMTDATKRDYSWSLPNRRFIDSGLYLPSIRSEGIDTIAVIVDTSGSLPAGTLAEFWAEIREIATELQPERVILLQVDAAVQDAAEYATADLPDEIAIRGRGGTDFRPGFAWLEEHDIQPGVCLYLTDMLCSSYPEDEPNFPVVWVNYAQPPGDWNREPWGERIDIGTSSGPCREPGDIRRPGRGAQAGTRRPGPARLLDIVDRRPRSASRYPGEHPQHARGGGRAPQGRGRSRSGRRPGRSPRRGIRPGQLLPPPAAPPLTPPGTAAAVPPSPPMPRTCPARSRSRAGSGRGAGRPERAVFAAPVPSFSSRYRGRFA